MANQVDIAFEHCETLHVLVEARKLEGLLPVGEGLHGSDQCNEVPRSHKQYD